MVDTAFIVGSPRSGTTLLGDLLDLHPSIGRWYEPYFVLDRYFRDAPDDRRTAADATDQVRRYVTRAFEDYARHRGCRMVVDKSPRNSLKMPFLHAIFPEARFVHILRDGRDATLSIHQQWQQRSRLAARRGSLDTWRTVKARLLDPQPVMAHKLAALRFEVGGPMAVLTGRGMQHRVRWQGRIGWGPRFSGWQEVIDRVSTLQFNALQWVRCVEAVLDDQAKLAAGATLTLRYETLLQEPEESLGRICEFLAVPFDRALSNRMPSLKRDNFDKWRSQFSPAELASIGPLLDPLLQRLGCAGDEGWYAPEATVVQEARP